MSNLTAVGAGQPKSWDDNQANQDGNGETCAACCQALDPVRVLPINWVEHAFTPVVRARATRPVNTKDAIKKGINHESF